jgi:hypothetical protein
MLIKIASLGVPGTDAITGSEGPWQAGGVVTWSFGALEQATCDAFRCFRTLGNGGVRPRC